MRFVKTLRQSGPVSKLTYSLTSGFRIFWTTSVTKSSSYPFISGDTFRAIADHKIERNRHLPNPQHVKTGHLVFCQSDEMHRLSLQFVSSFSGPAIILFGNSDRNQSGTIKELAMSDNVLAVFAQNLSISLPKVFALPIGLENRRLKMVGRPEHFRSRQQNVQVREMKIGWSFAVENNPTARETAKLILAAHPLAVHFGRVSVTRHQKLVQRFAFLACPPGNGLDTHRTWEAMYLGSIPIVLRSTAMEQFEQLGLPIWLIDDFQELIGLSKTDLEEKAQDLTPRFASPWLWMPAWRARFQVLAAGTAYGES